MDDFDLDKVEALNFDTLSPQLRYIFRSDEDIANFIQFLKNIQKFINLSNDKDVTNVLLFLRQREIVHFERFKELRNYYLNKYKKGN